MNTLHVKWFDIFLKMVEHHYVWFFRTLKDSKAIPFINASMTIHTNFCRTILVSYFFFPVVAYGTTVTDKRTIPSGGTEDGEFLTMLEND